VFSATSPSICRTSVSLAGAVGQQCVFWARRYGSTSDQTALRAHRQAKVVDGAKKAQVERGTGARICDGQGENDRRTRFDWVMKSPLRKVVCSSRVSNEEMGPLATKGPYYSTRRPSSLGVFGHVLKNTLRLRGYICVASTFKVETKDSILSPSDLVGPRCLTLVYHRSLPTSS